MRFVSRSGTTTARQHTIRKSGNTGDFSAFTGREHLVRGEVDLVCQKVHMPVGKGKEPTADMRTSKRHVVFHVVRHRPNAVERVLGGSQLSADGFSFFGDGVDSAPFVPRGRATDISIAGPQTES